MSYISGRGGVTSGSATERPVDQPQQGGRERAREGGGGSRFVPDLYPRRRLLGQQHTDTAARWTVWDNREQVASFSKGIEAHRACVNTRHTSPDSGRRLSLYDPIGRIVAVYIDGREQLDELSGSAFPVAGAR